MMRPILVSLCASLLLVGCNDKPDENPEPGPIENPGETPAPRGATVSWDEYEAEAGALSGGAALERTVSGAWLEGTLSGEASNREAVTLPSPSASIAWTSRVKANAVVVRYSVPDDKEAHLDVYVNDAKVATLTVNSDYAWLYTGPNNTETHNALPRQQVDELPQNPSPNDENFGLKLPWTAAHHIYDEAHVLLASNGQATIHPGDVVKLVSPDASAQVPVTVDFMDLELVPEPLSAPADHVVVREFTEAAIVRALQDAQSGGKPGIFLPPGDYVMAHENPTQPKVYVPAGLTVQGAGMWHTRIVPPSPKDVGYNHEFGFRLSGDNITFQDFAIFGSWRNRTVRYNKAAADLNQWPWDSYDGIGRAFDRYMHNNAVFKRLWIERMIVGGWVEGGNNMLWEDSRFRNTIADGINFCNGTTNSRIVNCTARNTGDDAFAMWSAITWDKSPIPETPWVHQPEGPNQGNVIERCTAGLIWRAAGFAVYGGHDNVIKDSVVYDTLRYPGITVDNEFAPQHEFSGRTTIQNMTVERCGGRMWWDDDGVHGDETARRMWGAVWLFAANPYSPAAPSSPLRFQGIRLKDIDIIDPVYAGVLVQSTQGQRIEDTELDGVRIVLERAGAFGFVANDSHKAPPSPLSGKIPTTGSLTLKNSSVTGARSHPGNLFSTDAPSTGMFSFKDGGGNTWTGDR
ncbi:secreted glycosyl hydrolase [Melittangium boletus]|uniref:secreted glycosyl hydrolase n=1 Tax=Melittangium boletus TaxID=83453 RepID=UPI003DA6C10E